MICIYTRELVLGKLFSYADDTAIVISKTSRETLVQSAVANVFKINKWFTKYYLRLNFNKLSLLVFFKVKKLSLK